MREMNSKDVKEGKKEREEGKEGQEGKLKIMFCNQHHFFLFLVCSKKHPHDVSVHTVDRLLSLKCPLTNYSPSSKDDPSFNGMGHLLWEQYP